jgi:hypothetical protein
MAVATNTDITPTGFLGHDGSSPGTMTLVEARALLALVAADLSDAGELATANYANLYRSGAGAPSVSARYVGDIYVNTTPNPDAVYYAPGPAIGAGAADWVLALTLGTAGNVKVVASGAAAEAWLDLDANCYPAQNTGDTAAEARLDKRGYTFALGVTADGTYLLPPWPDMPCTGVDVQAYTLAGSCSIKITKAGSDINGFSSAVGQTTTVSTTASTETYTKGDIMKLVVSSASSLTGVAGTINVKRTAT